MRMKNAKGERIYYNVVTKHGNTRYIVLSADGHPIMGRDKEKRKSRSFTQESQAEAWIKRQGYRAD